MGWALYSPWVSRAGDETGRHGLVTCPICHEATMNHVQCRYCPYTTTDWRTLIGHRWLHTMSRVRLSAATLRAFNRQNN